MIQVINKLRMINFLLDTITLYCYTLYMSQEKRKIANNKCEIIREVPEACCDEQKAVEFLEKLRWGGNPYCPHCGSVDVYQMRKRGTNERNARFLWRCNDCNKQFTVRIGTVFEDSRIPLKHWCYAFWAACASKKGVSALQIQRMTGLCYKSTLFMMHRIRYAMSNDIANPPKLNGTVETDETYVGGKPRYRFTRKCGHGTEKAMVFGMLQRDGEVRATHFKSILQKDIKKQMLDCIDIDSRLITDSWILYRKIGKPFRQHNMVKHSEGEYVRGDVYTNSIESFFALLKRGVYGTFHSVSKKHLHRFVGEFQFRYNTRQDGDGERLRKAIRNGVGKRLTYRQQVS